MIVLEIHYLQIVTVADTTSGIRLRLSRAPQEHAGGLASMAARFTIPPGQPAHVVPLKCCVNSMLPVRAFAMRAHTHALGRSVKLGHRMPNGTLQQMVDQDPQEPQVGRGVAFPRQHHNPLLVTFHVE
jgi:peptidylamidoglycolate lyase